MSAAYWPAAHRGRHLREDDAHVEAEETVDPAHVLGVALGQVVVDRDQVHAVAGQRVQVGGEHRGEGLALTGLHLRDVAQVQRGAAHQLDGEVALADRADRGLAGRRERLGQQLVQGLAVGVPRLELVGLRPQLGVGQRLHPRLERVDVRGDPAQPFHQLRLAGAEQAGKQRHGRPHSPITVRTHLRWRDAVPAPCPLKGSERLVALPVTPKGRAPPELVRTEHAPRALSGRTQWARRITP